MKMKIGMKIYTRTIMLSFFCLLVTKVIPTSMIHDCFIYDKRNSLKVFSQEAYVLHTSIEKS